MEDHRRGEHLRPLEHTAISVAVGAGTWAVTGSPMALGVAIGTGVLVDADHSLDYFNWYARKDIRFLFLPFHAWELSLALVALFVVWYHPLLLAAALGHVAHLVADQLANRLHPMAYLMTYRAIHRFDRDHLIGDSSPAAFSEVLEGNIPLWGHFRDGLRKSASLLERAIRNH